MRMQQSTAQVKLIDQADYNRIFRSTYRLIDYHLKQQYNQQQCIYCRRSKKQFRITYLEFPCEKQSIQEINDLIQQRVLQLLNTRFAYIAIALSADLMTTKRWAAFYKSLSEHKEINKTLLIRKINTIIQVYGLHAHVQQIQTLLTKFLDANRYETDVIETEQVIILINKVKPLVVNILISVGASTSRCILYSQVFLKNQDRGRCFKTDRQHYKVNTSI